MASITNPSNSNEVFTVRVISNGSDSIRIRGDLTTGGASSGAVANRYIYLVLVDEDGDATERYIVSAQTSGSKFYFPGPSAEEYASVDGLSPSTTYTWVATIAWGMNDDSLSAWAVLTGTVTTDAEIDVWSWDESNGSATPEETQRAYGILTGKVSLDEGFCYKVWNDFVDKVKKMRAYFGDGTWDTVGGTYLSYEASKVKAGDRLGALRYNSVKVQIGSIRTTDILDVEAGDRLSGYHIVHLVDVLNDIIADL